VFDSDKKLRKIKGVFDKHKKRIHSYIERQHAYIQDREKELKDIIDLLAKALATMDSENQVYNQEIYAQSEKIEQITRLDDIKRIKQELTDQIEQMRETVRKKQSHDIGDLEMLSKKVSVLDTELKKARADSMLDGLTGIGNRRAFDLKIRELVDGMTMSGSPLSLLMLDIDNFKKINDGYGHQIGDRVLVALARKCHSLIRNDDIMARYGGEEFVILLPNASLDNAVTKADSICKSIANTRYALDDVEPGNTLSITISIGVSVFSNGDSPLTVVERADKALYLAKRRGKNRVASEMDLEEDVPVTADSEQ
jgi:diguanylate cyclase